MPTIWHESDEFWRVTAPGMFPAQKLAAAEAEIGWIVRETGVGPARADGSPARVLDMPCGVGRHSLALARLGFAVTGVDRTSVYLDLARAREAELAATGQAGSGPAPRTPATPTAAGTADSAAPRTAGGVSWMLGDMRTFDGRGQFDLALNLYTSLGYFDEPAENQRVLDNLRRALRTGGTLVVDAMGKEVLAKVLMPTQWQDLPDGSVELREVRIVDDWRRADNRWIVITAEGKRIEHRVTHWLYDAAELRRMMETAGFKSLRAFGSLAGGEYGPSATRLVMIGEAG